MSVHGRIVVQAEFPHSIRDTQVFCLLGNNNISDTEVLSMYRAGGRVVPRACKSWVNSVPRQLPDADIKDQ